MKDPIPQSLPIPDLEQPKAAFRAWARGQLKLLSPDRERSGSAAAASHVLALLTKEAMNADVQAHHAPILLGYVPIRGEIDPIAILTYAFSSQMLVAVPRCAQRDAIPDLDSLPREALHSGSSVGWDHSHLEHDAWGMSVPRGLKPVRASHVVAALVPGLAFDRHGHRLGRGAGIYDRLLASLPPNALRIGLVHSDRIVPELPTDSHDIPMNVVVTPDEIIRAG